MGRPPKAPAQNAPTAEKQSKRTEIYDDAVKSNGKFYPAGTPVPKE